MQAYAKGITVVTRFFVLSALLFGDRLPSVCSATGSSFFQFLHKVVLQPISQHKALSFHINHFQSEHKQNSHNNKEKSAIEREQCSKTVHNDNSHSNTSE